MTALTAPLDTIALDPSTPTYHATWVDVTLAALLQPLKAKVGIDQPAPRKPRRRDSATRLAILNESAILYAVTA